MATIREMKIIADNTHVAVVDAFRANARARAIDRDLVAKSIDNFVAEGSALSRYVALLPRLQSIAAEHGPDAATEWSQTFWGLLRWRSFGYPTFMLSGSLTAAFALTDCGKLPADEWAPPFDAMLVQLPPPSPLWISDASGHNERGASSIFVSRICGFTDAQSRQWGLHEAMDQRAALELMATHNAEASPRTIIRLWPDPPSNFPSTHGNLAPAADGATFGEWLATIGSHIEPDEGQVASAIDETSIETAWRLSMSLWQYLGSLAPHGKPAAERFGPWRQGKARTYRVGDEIKLPAPRSALAGLGTAGWKLHARFMVRGHWRNQAHGPAMQERRRQWVMPYWKGPDSPQSVLDRSYSVTR